MTPTSHDCLLPAPRPGRGVFLLAAVLVLWRRQLAAMIRCSPCRASPWPRWSTILGAVSTASNSRLVAVPLGVLRAGVAALRWCAAPSPEARQRPRQRETSPLVNIAASLLAAALLVLLSYAVTRPLVALAPSPATRHPGRRSRSC